MRNLPTLFTDFDAENPRFSDLLDRFFERSLNYSGRTFAPQLDVVETAKEFEVTVALPGMKKDDIDISIENNVLTISGERKFEKSDDGRNYHRVETQHGRFLRSLPFPDIIDPDNINATYKDGMLHVTIPKLEEKAAKKIEVS